MNTKVKCNNCKNTISDPFCGHCGQPASMQRIDGRYILHEINHVLHFEKGISFTVKSLLISPGRNIEVFISENRNRLVKPILFIILTSLMYSLINHFFHVEQAHNEIEEGKGSAVRIIFDWFDHHLGYANIIMGMFIALWLKLFFRKSRYNFFEILILLCFVMGIGMLLFSLFYLLGGISGFQVAPVASLLVLIYCTWAIGQFFERNKAASYLKAFSAYVLGMITFYTTAFFLGLGIDIIG